jgi:hypothetical protein
MIAIRRIAGVGFLVCLNFSLDVCLVAGTESLLLGCAVSVGVRRPPPTVVGVVRGGFVFVHEFRVLRATAPVYFSP